MDIDIASAGFAAVGSAPRMQVLNLLVRSGTQGLTIGAIQAKSGIPASTLAHHLRALVEGGVIKQVKKGRSTYNLANYDHLEQLANYLLIECCADERRGE